MDKQKTLFKQKNKLRFQIKYIKAQNQCLF